LRFQLGVKARRGCGSQEREGLSNQTKPLFDYFERWLVPVADNHTNHLGGLHLVRADVHFADCAAKLNRCLFHGQTINIGAFLDCRLPMISACVWSDPQFFASCPSFRSTPEARGAVIGRSTILT